MEESAIRLSAVAGAEGLLSNDPLALYGNYVDANTPLSDIHGDNLPSLQALRTQIDPRNIMGLAGGFKRFDWVPLHSQFIPSPFRVPPVASLFETQ